MPDDAQTEPASMTQSTGDIVSMSQVVVTTNQHQHSPASPSPLRKGSAALIAEGRRSPTSALHRPRSPTGGAASKSTGKAVGVTTNGADMASTSQDWGPVFLDLPSSIGDHCSRRRPASLPTSRQDNEKTEVGRRPASEQRDGFDDLMPTDVAAFITTNTMNDTAELTDDDDLSWTTSLSHNCSPASRSTSGVAIQVASGAYEPPVSKIRNIFGMSFLRIMYV